ncbi:hypothetical protein FOXB_10686 [Fusarium oxysporum f. sp. conglutinans Fo5176]|uniref:Uncharacterized protein n=1 Tax=Fusarium oxysporum (strain Fo5176) TaxID=660025 RepID=F9FWA4_FUSOF|nr:hypothetical protein FOXB_10686 [Fusarium oxysporum f. sp. conglutinans Fo5176]
MFEASLVTINYPVLGSTFAMLR